MEMFTIRRRSAATTSEELESADARSEAVLAERADQLQRVRTYLVREPDGSFGTVCIYLATDADAIRAHAEAAAIPVDEINQVVALEVSRPDPVGVA